MSFPFVDNENAVREFWHTKKIFQKSLEQTQHLPKYVSYDGPPFATGKPHHGHLLASTIKDVVHRYFTQQGYYVERRFGWDCHGLPIEHEINKSLGMQAHEAVETLGIPGYNKACREIVMRYCNEWESTIDRLGRWVDFKHDYKTMDPEFMESVWWVFGQLWEKGMVYEGVKVMPYSTSLETPLSNFEASSNYQSVQDPSITVLISLKDSDEMVAIWTTTPWTLPSNQAIAINPDIPYCLIKTEAHDQPIWMAEALIPSIMKKQTWTVINTQPGSYLVGKTYVPLFDHFIDQVDPNCYQIYAGDFVQIDTGTGLVHMAPAFGEDDYQLCQKHDIKALLCPIDEQGRFDQSITKLTGQYIKDADKQIIAELKAQGQLFKQDVVVHNYPFCPRSDTPLIYKAVPSWFVSVSKIQERLQKANEQINWVPGHIKHGRFGKWLENARDWAISRNRVWGTPIPLWRNNQTGEIICIDSIAKLEKYSGQKVSDLHREHIDHLTFTEDGKPGEYHRIPEVLDCWFESGAMPYAQSHYPFENKESFDANFPAQFIAEGLDQTRGWFYTLTVLSTILFDRPAFTNVIVSGIVVAEDGRKMSKRLRNYTPPDELMSTYGADALRLYLISSGLVKGEEQRFVDDGVKHMTRTTLLPWINAFNFFETYASIDQWREDSDIIGHSQLDRWILSRLQTLKEQVNRNMQAYQLYLVIPPLLNFIDELTNTYIRMNRSRFWRNGTSDDKAVAYQTLFQVLSELTTLMAPFAPHLSEHIYLKLKTFSQNLSHESVHLCSYPSFDASLQDVSLELGVKMLQEVINMARSQRLEAGIRTKTPLKSITIIHQDTKTLEAIKPLAERLQTEINVKSVIFSQNEADYVTLYAKPNLPILGRQYGAQIPELKKAIEQLDSDALRQYEETGEIEAGSFHFKENDLLVFRDIVPGVQAASNRHITIAMDTELTEALIAEGKAREMVSQIQKVRKDLDLTVDQRIHLVVYGPESTLDIFNQHKDYIQGEVLALDSQIFEVEQNHLFVDIEGSFSIIIPTE